MGCEEDTTDPAKLHFQAVPSGDQEFTSLGGSKFCPDLYPFKTGIRFNLSHIMSDMLSARMVRQIQLDLSGHALYVHRYGVYPNGRYVTELRGWLPVERK